MRPFENHTGPFTQLRRERIIPSQGAKGCEPAGERNERRADLETQHENRNTAADCVYNEQLPFARLTRDIMEGHYRGVGFTPQALSWLQFMVEFLLIKVSIVSGKIVKDITIGPRRFCGTLQRFPNCVPVFGDSREILRVGQAGGGRVRSTRRRARERTWQRQGQR